LQDEQAAGNGRRAAGVGFGGRRPLFLPLSPPPSLPLPLLLPLSLTRSLPLFLTLLLATEQLSPSRIGVPYPMMSAPPIAIIGAGAAGLAAAYELTRAGHRVRVYEGSSQVGGLAGGFTASHWDWSLEYYYHHWFASDRHLLGLIAELGWSDQVLFRRPYTVVWHEDRFHPLDSKVEALKFCLRHLHPVDTLRFGLVAAYLRLNPFWRPLERVTADAWMRRWSGARLYETLWRPLLVGKFGEENLGRVNMAWLWARIRARTTRLGTFEGGFQRFFDRLADVVRSQGAEIHLQRRVESIATDDASGGVGISSTDGGEVFPALIFTGSPTVLARLASQLPAAYGERLRALRSLGAVALVLALDRRLTRYYWHNLPKAAGFPFLVLNEHTNFVDRAHFGGDHIVYCGDYLPPEHELFNLDEDQVLERYLPALSRFNPDFDPGWVRHSWLHRTPYAQPVPTLNHSHNLPDIRTPLPGLYLASMSQVYPWDRGTNFAVELGRRAARMAMEDLRTRVNRPA
jgi:protoporphyrinogen oxidase